MRLTIPEARVIARRWADKRQLPPAAFVRQQGYNEAIPGRLFSAVMDVRALERWFCLIEFVVHDDGHVSIVKDAKQAVIEELRSHGINPYKMPPRMTAEEALDFFVASISLCRERPEWFLKLDQLIPYRSDARSDALVEVKGSRGDSVITIPVKILPSRQHKKDHMREIAGKLASQMIAMVVNRHLTDAQIAAEFFTRAGHLRQSYAVQQSEPA